MTTTDPQPPDRTFAVLASTMRSGSTLLKALLAGAPDVSHLPEVNFQSVLPSPAKRRKLEESAAEPILLLKRPAWFHETGRYPRIPDGLPVRRILLLRDAYETVRSVGRMLGGKRFDRFPGFPGQRFLARRYWAPVTRRLLAVAREHPGESILVRYETLLEAPEEETLRVFRFLGSVRTSGTRSYANPDGFRWKWGSDDGSERIRTKEVQPPRPLGAQETRRRERLLALPQIHRVREEAGYA